MEKEKTKVEISLQPINIKSLKVGIVGQTPLLMDRLPEATKNAVMAKQTGLAKGNKKLLRNVNEEVNNAVHITSTGQIGFPVYGFKKGMMECTSFLGDKSFSKKLVSGAVKIMNVVDGLIPVKFEKQDVLTHTIGVQTKFSPQFHDWRCELHIQYDANNISATDIVTLLNYAGFYQGIGAWRPKGKDGGSGEYGMYKIDVRGGNSDGN